MLYKSNIILSILMLLTTQIYGHKEITGILQQATDLSPEDIITLWPLFNYLQDQYDYIASRIASNDLDEDPQFMALYADTQKEFENHFEYFIREYEFFDTNNNTDRYNTRLPSITELMGVANLDLTTEELAERVDIESLLDDALNEAQSHIDDIIRRSLQLQSQFLKINKPKIVKYIYMALSVLYRMAARVGRAAYCTYSHIPQLNESLQNIYGGVDCYTYSKRLVLNIEHETVKTVSTIHSNVFSLAGIYKKIADKKSLLGKLSAVLLNLPKIVNSIRETYQTGINAFEKLQNEVPSAVNESVSCGRDFADGVPQMMQTVANLSSCITFIDDSTNDYDFMKPEKERDFI